MAESAYERGHLLNTTVAAGRPNFPRSKAPCQGVACAAASRRARSRARRAGPFQPQLHRAIAKEPFSITEVVCSPPGPPEPAEPLGLPPG
ncbi:hypothetical protein SAMN05216259_12088 [Actinacidiphila guanduensis]|uniref:Uncharacterized protein n=1 Tax=Actinacidiphila guanduensis TaxID=310781 RepID=A0A1H0R1C8_9ACTN|nr:hypothetical protein SAMN05216259_12088 [Actinacidiphila guanduensis]